MQSNSTWMSHIYIIETYWCIKEPKYIYIYTLYISKQKGSGGKSYQSSRAAWRPWQGEQHCRIRTSQRRAQCRRTRTSPLQRPTFWTWTLSRSAPRLSHGACELVMVHMNVDESWYIWMWMSNVTYWNMDAVTIRASSESWYMWMSRGTYECEWVREHMNVNE